MTTNIFKYDGTLLTSVMDRTIDTAHSAIKIPGKGTQNYGEIIIESLVWLLENFNGTVSPSNPIIGQLWYDSSLPLLRVWNGSAWVSTGGVINSATQPSGAFTVGSFWYDTYNQQLSIWTGVFWKIVGPLGSALNNDPTSGPSSSPPSQSLSPVPTYSALDAVKIVDTHDVQHQVWRLTIGNVLFAVISKDQAFIPNSNVHTEFSNFTGVGNDFKIYPGINFTQGGSVSNLTIVGDSSLFTNFQNNVPSQNNAFNLGSPSAAFANLYSYNAAFHGAIAIGTAVDSNYNLKVSGSSYFGEQVLLGAGNTLSAPLVMTNGNITTVPEVGAIEFDGVDFYFTGTSGGLPIRQVPIFGTNRVSSNRIYVSVDGSDLNNGSSINPYKTIKAALNAAVSGDTIFVSSGEYDEHNPLYIPPKVSVIGDSTCSVTVLPLHPRLDLFHVSSGVYVCGITVNGLQSTLYSTTVDIPRVGAAAFAFNSSLATANVAVDGTISSIEYRWSSGGYVSPQIFIEPPLNGGTQATATPVIVTGIQEVVLSNGGAGYVSPVITAVGSGNSVSLSARVESGVIQSIEVLNPGDGVDPNNISISITDGFGSGAVVSNIIVASNMIGSFVITNPGSGYTFQPVVSIAASSAEIINEHPYIQNCSLVSGPFDIFGQLITANLPYDPIASNLDKYGSGTGTLVDGYVLDSTSLVHSIIVDSFNQINQGGIGHLVVNSGSGQFINCTSSFCSYGHWSRSGGKSIINDGVISFGNIGIQSDGFYPIAYATGESAQNYTSSVAGFNVSVQGSGYNYNNPPNILITSGIGGGATAIAIINDGITDLDLITAGAGYQAVPSVNITGGDGGGAVATAILNSPSVIDVIPIGSGNLMIPENGSLALINGVYYDVVDAVTDGGSGYNITISPAIPYVNTNTTIRFFRKSSVLSNNLFESIGSGVTYNALPVNGGYPNISQETNEGYYGRVYSVTINDDGNYKIDDLFKIDFATGNISLGNANSGGSLEINGVTSIGPFKRNGVSAGVQLQEVSDNPNLTHSISSRDHNTVPTEYAVRNYVGNYVGRYTSNIAGNVNPSTDNLYTVGNVSARWNNGNFANLSVGTLNASNIISNDITANVGTFTTLILDVITGNAVGDTATYTTIDVGTIHAGNITADHAIFGNLSVSHSIVGNITGSAQSLTTASNIVISGAITGSTMFDGSSNVNINSNFGNITAYSLLVNETGTAAPPTAANIASFFNTYADPSGGFTQSNTTNGWSMGPNGVLEQWMTTTVSAGGSTSITWPISFPTACTFATCTNLDESGGSGTQNNPAQFDPATINTTGGTVKNAGNGTSAKIYAKGY